MTTHLHPDPPAASPIWTGDGANEDVDEIMRDVQGGFEKTQVDRFRTVSVRMGVAGTLNSVYVMETDEWKG